MSHQNETESGTLFATTKSEDKILGGSIRSKKAIQMWEQFCSWWGYNGYGWIGLILGILLFGGGYLLRRAITVREQAKNSFPPNPQRERCPRCHSPVEDAYLRCPECNYKLKVNCPSCGRIVKATWEICPYCETKLNPVEGG